MKSPSLLLASLLLAAIGLSSFVLAQQKPAERNQPKKPQTWEEKKKTALPKVTDEQKASVAAALPQKATAKPKSPRKILVFYRCEGFIHKSIPAGNHALAELGKQTGAFEVDLADTYDVFTPENLEQYDAILFNNTTHLKFDDPAHREALMDFIKEDGKGIIGIHAASDNFGSWPEALEMMGGIFNGHPWTAGGTWAFKLDDPDNPLNAAFNGESFMHKDEIYQYKPESYAGTDKLRILVSLDMKNAINTEVLKNPKFAKFNDIYGSGPREVPVSWLRDYGNGRLFYSNFGHNPDTFWNPAVLQHYSDGIQFALGDLEANATPTDS
ncbi:MAG: ThuA domain-containing protein [Verrucomicrobiota bacterium]